MKNPVRADAISAEILVPCKVSRSLASNCIDSFLGRHFLLLSENISRQVPSSTSGHESLKCFFILFGVRSDCCWSMAVQGASDGEYFGLAGRLK